MLAGGCTSQGDGLADALPGTTWQSPALAPSELQREITAGREPRLAETVEFRRDSTVVFRSPGLAISGRYTVFDSVQVFVRFDPGARGMLLGDRTLRVRLSAGGDTLSLEPNPLTMGQGPGTFVPLTDGAAR